MSAWTEQKLRPILNYYFFVNKDIAHNWTQLSLLHIYIVFHNRWYAFRLTRQISLLEQELLILLEQMGSSSVLVELVVFSRKFSVYSDLSTIVCPFVTFRFAIIIVYRGGSRGCAPHLKLEKIWLFCVKSWFFTRNTPNIYAPRYARRGYFACAT